MAKTQYQNSVTGSGRIALSAFEAEGSGRRRFDDSGALSGSAGESLDAVQVSDQAIMAHMRTQLGTSILDLAEKLSVTDTAIRQRLTRLMDRGLVERFALREGRGRPKHVYRLTEAGVRASGANLDDLAVALWQELVGLEDAEVRERLLLRVVDRLAARYSAEVYGATIEQRIRSVVELFNRRGIPFAFERVNGVSRGAGRQGDRATAAPVDGAVGRLVVLGCPYPGLQDEQRLVCRMEQLLFQKLIGVPVDDVTPGSSGGCCSFIPVQLELGRAEAGSSEGVERAVGKNGCGQSRCDCRGNDVGELNSRESR
jgi:predicted ArsR family transcriptional regulator